MLDFQSDIFKAMKDAQNGVERKEGEESAEAKLAKRKRILETVTIADESTKNATAISSIPGAKIIKKSKNLPIGINK